MSRISTRLGSVRWSADELELLGANVHVEPRELQETFEAAGFYRSANAIFDKLYALRRAGKVVNARAAEHTLKQPGWPSTPAPEMADRMFVRAVLTAMLAETRARERRMNPRIGQLRQDMAEAERHERAEIIRQITLAHLTEAHGPRRAASIMAGTDTAANADIAAWRNLGVRKP